MKTESDMVGIVVSQLDSNVIRVVIKIYYYDCSFDYKIAWINKKGQEKENLLGNSVSKMMLEKN